MVQQIKISKSPDASAGIPTTRRDKRQYFINRKNRSTTLGTHQPRVPDWWEREVKAKRGTMLVCQKCGAVYLKKHWYTSPTVSEFLKKQKNIKYTVCGECVLKPRSARWGISSYEGEINLLNLGPDKPEILRLVKNVGARAVKRDPEDQILRIEDQKDSVRILTSENQLALSIGKQVAQAFKGGILKIQFSHQEEVARVTWTHK
jgi:hypothetical protein